LATADPIRLKWRRQRHGPAGDNPAVSDDTGALLVYDPTTGGFRGLDDNGNR